MPTFAIIAKYQYKSFSFTIFQTAKMFDAGKLAAVFVKHLCFDYKYISS